MGSQNIYRSGPYGSCQDGSFQKEVIPNRALNSTQLPERATSEAVKAVPSKQKCCQIGPTVTSNSRIGPFEGFQDDKKTVETGSQNIYLPERALRKLSRRASLKRNCCQSGPTTISNNRSGGGPYLGLGNTEAGPNNRSGPHCGSLSRRDPSKKKLLPKRVNDIQLPERTPTEATKTGPSKKKLLLKRAHGRIQLPERASTEAV